MICAHEEPRSVRTDGRPPGNPLANCPEQFSEAYASDRQALMRDESTYSTNVFLDRLERKKSARSKFFSLDPRGVSGSRGSLMRGRYLNQHANTLPRITPRLA